MAVLDTAIIFLIRLLVGAAGIYVGVMLVADRDIGFLNAAFTALIGALLALIAWIGVINWRYPGGWGTAIGIGLVAWPIAGAVLYGLSTVDIVSPSALGVPGV